MDTTELLTTVFRRCSIAAREGGTTCREDWPDRLQYWCASCVIGALRETAQGLATERDQLKDAIVSWDGGLTNTPTVARTTAHVLRVFNAEQAAAADERERLRAALALVAERLPRRDTDHDTHRTWCTGCDAPFVRASVRDEDAAHEHRPNCVWVAVDAALEGEK